MEFKIFENRICTFLKRKSLALFFVNRKFFLVQITAHMYQVFHWLEKKIIILNAKIRKIKCVTAPILKPTYDRRLFWGAKNKMGFEYKIWMMEIHVHGIDGVHCFVSRQYLWLDDKGKKLKLTAPQYINYAMSYIQKYINDESVLPTKYGKFCHSIFVFSFGVSWSAMAERSSTSDLRSDGWVVRMWVRILAVSMVLVSLSKTLYCAPLHPGV